MTRTYDMTNRARSSSQTRERIVSATENLLASGPVEEVTLLAIAGDAGVTVQTVLRHMDSRDGCFRAVRERVQRRVQHQRESSAPGDVAAAITTLMAHYEADGRLMLNLLAQEARNGFAAEAASSGRDYHRAWVDRCLGPRVRRRDEQTLDTLVTATDLYVWKLLRLDLGRSAEQSEAVVTRLVHAILESS